LHQKSAIDFCHNCVLLRIWIHCHITCRISLPHICRYAICSALLCIVIYIEIYFISSVETAVNAVVRGKNITEQGEVDAMAKAIEDALAALQYKDADKTTPAPTATATPAPAATATPQYTIPQTGDTSNPALLVVLMLVSGSAAIGIAVVGSKKKHNG